MTDRRQEILSELLQQFTPGFLIDLGTGDGGFARLAADAGWWVTATDARRRDRPEHPRITWVTEDVRVTDLSGFDLILCIGLFYHLTFQDQIRLLHKCAGTPLIVDTHLAASTERSARFGPYEGRMYQEPNWWSDPWGSWQNAESFWPTLDSFERMARAYGRYTSIIPTEPWHASDRTFFFLTGERPWSSGKS